MRTVLPIIVISQFLCTSLWFAGNAIIPEMEKDFQLGSDFLAHQTSAIQFGFISGTFLFALFTISDRFSPSLVFFVSSILAALFNLGISLPHLQAWHIYVFRFSTGFFLAGIYPVGMKIASDYYKEGLGKSLGYLVGALVIGTAFPHVLRGLTAHFPWRYVIFATSALSLAGGLVLFAFVPDGPHRKSGRGLQLNALLSGFQLPRFRSAAFGYFGHMWELYTFWAFVPFILSIYDQQFHNQPFNIPLLSFCIIAFGGPACVAGGYASAVFGAGKMATLFLVLSGFCCLASPLFFQYASPAVFLCFLFFWSFVVIADSPLFSTLVAQNAPEISRGTALTIINCIGFSVTIISIQVLNALSFSVSSTLLFTFLAIGPALGVTAMWRGSRREK